MPRPLNGRRNISEFVCFGEVVAMPDPESVTDEAWADFVWFAHSAAAEYLWDCLTDAMAEFDGRPVGWSVVRDLNPNPLD